MNFEKIKFKKEAEDKEKIAEEKSRARQAQARFAMKTMGFFERYKRFLGIPISRKFLGETVLDLGAGYSGELPEHAARRGIKVYSLSESFSDEHYRKLLKKHLSSKLNKKFPFTAGLAQELPFKSNSFDSVLSCWAIPMYLETNKEEHEAAFKEIVRVLKPGGKAYLGPLGADEFEYRKEIVEKLKQEFKEEKFANIKLNKRNVVVISKPKERKKNFPAVTENNS